ncbi:hypothetical protein CXB51_008477 [Gossypium anomalum]|uniref:Uncharacterized protein n=1 Tax=Gossypium anomalum TaxID=47600 RepID=A0A8J5ZK70_9ROSI|nr:hypothetical protein CXB51_008477 [Gossypium anomalum]
MMINQRLVSQKHSQWPPESFRLSPGLRASAVLLLPWMSETFLTTKSNIKSMMISCKACFSKHSQWPSKSFRLSPGLRACAASFLPWMSETFYDFYMIACFSKHSQWPPKSFRLSPGLRACAASFLPWIGRLRAFAVARLESLCCFIPSLDV